MLTDAAEQVQVWASSAVPTFGASLEKTGSLQLVILGKSVVQLKGIRDFAPALCACRSLQIILHCSQEYRLSMGSRILACCIHRCHQRASSNQASTPSALRLPLLMQYGLYHFLPSPNLEAEAPLAHPRPCRALQLHGDRY